MGSNCEVVKVWILLLDKDCKISIYTPSYTKHLYLDFELLLPRLYRSRYYIYIIVLLNKKIIAISLFVPDIL